MIPAARRSAYCHPALAFALALTIALACSPGDSVQTGREADLEHAVMTEDAARRPPPEQLVSLSPIASALLVELGEAERLLMVDAESALLPGLEAHPRLPHAELAAVEVVRRLAPDRVLVPEARPRTIERLRAAGLDVLEVAVHDFDDGFALWRALGLELGREAEVHTRILEASRPLARLAIESYGRPRPRVAAIDSLEPLELAGDHSFVGGLIEMAGGENVTHGWGERSLRLDLARLRALAPALIVRATSSPLSEVEREVVERTFHDVAPVVFVRFDPVGFFTPTAERAARAIRDRLLEVSGEAARGDGAGVVLAPAQEGAQEGA